MSPLTCIALGMLIATVLIAEFEMLRLLCKAAWNGEWFDFATVFTLLWLLF